MRVSVCAQRSERNTRKDAEMDFVRSGAVLRFELYARQRAVKGA